MEGGMFLTGATTRHLSIKAEDLRTGQAGGFQIESYFSASLHTKLDDGAGQRTVIETKLSQEETRDAIEELALSGKLIGHLWLTDITDGDLLRSRW